jgi:LPS-assembly lipoprotein
MMGDESMIKVVVHHPSPITRHRTGHAACKGAAWWLLVTTLALLVAGCGFHLRGSLGELEALPPMLVRGSGSLATELQRALRSGGTPVVSDPALARLIVTLTDIRRDRRVSAVGSTGKVEEFELNYSTRFRVDDPAGNNLAPEQVVSVIRSYTFDETDVNAKSNEEANLYEDMQFDMVRQILLRLQAISTSISEIPAPESAP